MSSTFDDSIRTLFKSGGVILLGVVLQLFLSFLAKLLIARELTQADFGSIALGMTIATFGSTIVQLGFPQAIGRYLPRYESTENRRSVLVTAFSFVVPLAVGMTIVLVVISPFLAENVFDTPSSVGVFQIFAFVMLMAVIERLTIGTVQGLKQSVPKVLLENVANPVSRFAAVGVVLVVGVTPIRFAWAYFAGRFIPAVLGVVYLYKETPLFRLSPSVETRYREMLRFSLPLVVSSAIALVYADIDKLMLGYFRTSAEVGVYDVVYSIGNLLTTGLLAFNFVFMPIISEYHSNGRFDDLRRMYLVVAKWIAVITFPVFLLMALFPEVLISVTFGAKYSVGAMALRVVAIGFCIHALAGLNAETLVSFGKTRIILMANLAAATVNVLLNLVLIPRYGPLGAGAATAVTYLLLNAMFSGYLYRFEDIPPFSKNAAKPMAVAAVLVGVVYTVVRLYLSPSLLTVAGFVAVFSFLYGVVLLRFGAVESEEVMIIKSIEERFDIDLTPVKRIGHIFFRDSAAEDDVEDARR